MSFPPTTKRNARLIASIRSMDSGADSIRLFTAALYANKYLVVKIKGAVGWLNPLE
jgi:hypothetical protein